MVSVPTCRIWAAIILIGALVAAGCGDVDTEDSAPDQPEAAAQAPTPTATIDDTSTTDSPIPTLTPSPAPSPTSTSAPRPTETPAIQPPPAIEDLRWEWITGASSGLAQAYSSPNDMVRFEDSLVAVGQVGSH